jgi:hypothetical protein
MTEEEKDKYLGNWHSYDFLFRDLVAGDLVMFETFEDVRVVEVSAIDNLGNLWHFGTHKWIIPKEQIIAVKED